MAATSTAAADPSVDLVRTIRSHEVAIAELSNLPASRSPSGEKERVCSFDNAGIEWNALSGNQLVSGAYVNAAGQRDCMSMEIAVFWRGYRKLIGYSMPNDDKWRVLPFGIKPIQHTENWTCSMFMES
ncbi:hypothetical protein Tsubulata_008200 [Turnera subulata]|uniref:Uncharacterized protein n=1 Tax=Turnera subulata TaxID=218843 RepID=A0A9Q0FB47_9ROSI|nr:hypothetical protein Tsubulata_008200 [Turnera subulata]